MPIAGSFVVLFFLASLGLVELKISTDNRIFYGDDNPYFDEYLQFEDSYTSNDNILFVLHTNAPFPNARFPEVIRHLTHQVRNLKHVIRVDSIANYPFPIATDDTVVVENFLDWACPRERACREVNEIEEAITSKHLANRFISSDRQSVGILATVDIERGAVGEIESLHSQTKVLAAQIEAEFPAFEVYITGGVPMMAAFAEATATDLSALLPIALIIILVLLRLTLGSTTLTALIFSVASVSAVATLGIAGWTGHVINNATSIVPLIIFTLVTASSMHIAVHYSRGLNRTNSRAIRDSQARASLGSTVTPIIASNATTAVSLLSLVFVDSPPLRQLGLLASLGVTVGLLLTLTLFPAFLSSTGRSIRGRVGDQLQNALNRYAQTIEQNRFKSAAPVLVFALCLIGLFNLRIDEDFVKFFDRTTEFRSQTDTATELLAGPNHIEVLLDATSDATVFDPKYIEALVWLTEQIRSHRHAANAFSFSDILDEVSLAYTDKPITAANSADEIAQLFLLYELSLQQGQSNTDFVRSDHNQARISVLLGETSSRDVQDLEKFIQGLQRQIPNYRITVTGENIPVAHLSRMNIVSMLLGIAISLTFTATLIALLFRDWNMGAVALISTILPVAAGFGVWGWLFGSIGLAATAIVALTIGIVVDDTVHLIFRFLDGKRRLNLSGAHAAAYAIHRAGVAISATSIALVGGLSALLVSDFEINSTLGGMTCLIILLALLFDLFLLPRVLARPS